MLGIKNAALFI